MPPGQGYWGWHGRACYLGMWSCTRAEHPDSRGPAHTAGCLRDLAQDLGPPQVGVLSDPGNSAAPCDYWATGDVSTLTRET